jgi:teichoic acid transport system permease protein
MATASKAPRDRGFTPDVQVYEPHRTGLPKLGPYFRELWRRRQFAYELSRTTLRAQHFNTAFGQVWLVLNPLLLATVYFMLVNLLSAGKGLQFFAHLLAGLFSYYFISNAISTGAGSVVGGGKLILNTSFPRALLPLSSVMTAFMRFLPTTVVYAVAHIAAGQPIDPALLWTIPILVLVIMFAAGMSMLVAAAQVYFRDLGSFLPYFLRIWLYLSPVLFTVQDVENMFGTDKEWLGRVMHANPLYYILGAWTQVLDEGKAPDAALLGVSALCAVVALVVGALFFMSREREFAVRL